MANLPYGHLPLTLQRRAGRGDRKLISKFRRIVNKHGLFSFLLKHY